MAISDPCTMLERLVSEPHEHPWLEFKRGNANPQQIGEYISALANSAMLEDRDRAFLVFGVEDDTHTKVGTSVRLKNARKGGESLENWLVRLLDPRLMIEIVDFECENKNFSLICIEPTYERPVRFAGEAYIRVGQNKRKLSDLPSYERALWTATGRRKFEQGVAKQHLSSERIVQLLNYSIYYDLSGKPEPENDTEIIRQLQSIGAIVDNMQGGFDITNLGAILFANDLQDFPILLNKKIRLIKYTGVDKTNSDFEIEVQMGYAVGFRGLIRDIMSAMPQKERYISGVRKRTPIHPEVSVREVVANAIIHQDFTLQGTGPIIEIYGDRIEVTNPGKSLIEADRMLDERRSRNERLASLMRDLGLCEERGGGLDKALAEVESQELPPPEFTSSAESMRVVLFGPKPFSELTKNEKLRACFFHCILRWLIHSPMSNATLRARFGLKKHEYQSISTIISASVRQKRIIPADPDQGKRNARYIPYFAG